MTSREIAELTGKEHAHVMRHIRAMLSELEFAEGGYLQNWIHPQNGQNYQEFALNRELTETLLTGYSASARLKVIRRWHDHEQQGNGRPDREAPRQREADHGHPGRKGRHIPTTN